MSEDKYTKVWIDQEGDIWTYPPSDDQRAYYGPITEYQIVPADAIVIERGDLPIAEWNFFMKRVEAGGYWGDRVEPPEYHEDIVRAHLAIAEYLRANPPVDEAQVAEIRRLAAVADVTLSGKQVETIARYFALVGVRAPAEGVTP